MSGSLQSLCAPRLCVTTETRPLDRLGQLGEFEQDSNTDSELESNTASVQRICVAFAVGATARPSLPALRQRALANADAARATPRGVSPWPCRRCPHSSRMRRLCARIGASVAMEVQRSRLSSGKV